MAEPTVDVVANIDVVAHKDVAEIREALAQQVSGAVQWVKTIKSFEEMGVTHIVEVGPGRVLNGLIKRIAPSIEVKNINSQESLNAVFEELK
jgi:[acyl-carrier-protein] S-malonyltransferase